MQAAKATMLDEGSAEAGKSMRGKCVQRFEGAESMLYNLGLLVTPAARTESVEASGGSIAGSRGIEDSVRGHA